MSADVALWRIAADTPNYTADDASGEGARQTGGRWNRAGLPVLYTSASISLACLETLVHHNGNTLPLNRYLVKIAVPGTSWQRARAFQLSQATIGWDALPAGKVSLEIGDNWLKSKASLLMRVPSIIVPDEWNVLINPLHPDMANLTVTKIRRWTYDARLIGS